jgi:hypothetical protein
MIYQREQGNDQLEDVQSAQSYYARHLQNMFAYYENGRLKSHVPFGGILDLEKNEMAVDKFRLQANYETKKNRFRLFSLAGIEASRLETDSTWVRHYGYYGDRRQPVGLRYENYFPLFYDPSLSDQIPQPDKAVSAYDYFASYYTNVGMTLYRRYTLSLSGRLDQSNLFGAKTNRKIIPLYSAGIKWDISEERFYNKAWPFITARVTYGLSGNLNKSTTAYTTSIATQVNDNTILSLLKTHTCSGKEVLCGTIVWS